MIKGIKEQLNGEITEPLMQSILIYIFSYVLSILLSSIPVLGLFAPSESNEAVLEIVFTDCVVSATITLTVSTMVQNFAVAIQNGIRKCILTFLLILVVLIDVIVYTVLRGQGCSHLTIITFAVSLLTSVISLFAVAQIEKWKSPKDPSR